MGFITGYLKTIIISFIFDYAWDNLISFLELKVQETDNKYDDNLIVWVKGLRDSFEKFVKDIWN